jgi:hypothetical protein
MWVEGFCPWSASNRCVCLLTSDFISWKDIPKKLPADPSGLKLPVRWGWGSGAEAFRSGVTQWTNFWIEKERRDDILSLRSQRAWPPRHQALNNHFDPKLWTCVLKLSLQNLGSEFLFLPLHRHCIFGFIHSSSSAIGGSYFNPCLSFGCVIMILRKAQSARELCFHSRLASSIISHCKVCRNPVLDIGRRAGGVRSGTSENSRADGMELDFRETGVETLGDE